MATTHTYAILEVSKPAYCEILKGLLEAGYEHAVDTDSGVIDMHGIALQCPDEAPTNG